jgi:hypothetical protein
MVRSMRTHKNSCHQIPIKQNSFYLSTKYNGAKWKEVPDHCRPLIIKDWTYNVYHHVPFVADRHNGIQWAKSFTYETGPISRAANGSTSPVNSRAVGSAQLAASTVRSASIRTSHVNLRILAYPPSLCLSACPAARRPAAATLPLFLQHARRLPSSVVSLPRHLPTTSTRGLLPWCQGPRKLLTLPWRLSAGAGTL